MQGNNDSVEKLGILVEAIDRSAKPIGLVLGHARIQPSNRFYDHPCTLRFLHGKRMLNLSVILRPCQIISCLRKETSVYSKSPGKIALSSIELLSVRLKHGRVDNGL